MKKLWIAGFLLIALCAAFAISLHYFFFTHNGANVIFRHFSDQYLGSEVVKVKKIEGSLYHGVSIIGLEINNFEGFPEGASFKTQRLDARLTSPGIHGLSLAIDNGRFRISSPEIMLIFGNYKGSQFDFDLLFKNILFENIITLFSIKSLENKPVSGLLEEADLVVTGKYPHPKLTGSFIVKKFIYDQLKLENIQGLLDLDVDLRSTNTRASGKIEVQSGQIFSDRTKIELGASTIYLLKSSDLPQLDINGHSLVENVKIQIHLKGTTKIPDIQLSSEPHYPRERLMVMLATGKSWQSLEDAYKKGEINKKDIGKDFLDYLIFHDTNNKFAKIFRLDKLTVDYNKERTTISGGKTIKKKLEINASLEQSNGHAANGESTQRVEGNYQLNDNLAVKVEREIKQKNNEQLPEEIETDKNDRVILEYKTTY